MNYMLRRIAARTFLGVWRQRTAVLLAAAVSVGLGAFALADGAVVGLPASRQAITPDCADAAILALSSHDPDASQRAYACMDSSYQQRVTESQFIGQLEQQATPNVEKVARVGDYHSPAGGTIVYYALEGNGVSAGYMVYLDPSGRVLRIE